jgi:uncharacterized protein
MCRIILVALVAIFSLLPAGCKMNKPSQEPAPFEGPRTPENIKKFGNHLVNEPSLYLQQHAYNPLDWYPWGEEALQRAREEDKPIFLSIGYSSCHWCHVMEHEVFEHDDVATFMNEHFICIKVDREERPDLDSVYMEAVQMMTGRGGWPMSVFLTPDLKPFHGGTYFPHDQFMNLVQQIQQVYQTRRDELNQQGSTVAQRIAASSNLQTHSGVQLDEAILKAVVDRAREAYDPANGGFQQSQKFPTPARWRFLLHEFRHAADEELENMIITTLEAMQGGGIYDHVGGGFHRYTVDQYWTVPHFEKMLYDNGQLAGLFLEAGVVFGREDFITTGTDVLDFLIREMRADDGGFFASYDADSGGEEGTYYIWDEDEITSAVGKEDGPALAEVLGISKNGNFEHTGKSVVTRRPETPDENQLLSKHRLTLRKVRDQRVPPGLDRKIITSWNGLVLASLAQAYAATGNREYLDAGKKTADFILDKHRAKDGSLLRSSSDGKVSGEAILDDYAFFADALIELYQVTGETSTLQAAIELVDYAMANFGQEGGGFHLTAAGTEAPLGRRVEHFDSVTPSGNAVMLQNLIRLTAITGETVYLAAAKTQLDSEVGLMERAGFEMVWSCDAARKVISKYYSVVIAGEGGKMFESLVSRLPVNAVCCPVPGKGAGKDLLKIAPALESKIAIGGKTTAYVCEFGTCKAPTVDTKEMLGQVFSEVE